MVCESTLLPSALSKMTWYDVEAVCGRPDVAVASVGVTTGVAVLKDASFCWPVAVSSNLVGWGGLIVFAVASAAVRLPMIMLAGRMTMTFKRSTTMADREDASGWHMIATNPFPKIRRSNDENPKFFIDCVPGTFPVARQTLAYRVGPKRKQHPDKSSKKCYVKFRIVRLFV